jgi:hypothetical protein
MEKKLCPICKKHKPISDYHTYFSKERNKYRVGNYCKLCANEKANVYSKKYYKENKEKILNYQNFERKAWKIKSEKQHREELSDRYILVKLKQTLKGESNKIMRKFPEMIEAKRTQILTSRIIKKLKDGKK